MKVTAELLHIRIKYFTMRCEYGSKGGLFMTDVIYALKNIFAAITIEVQHSFFPCCYQSCMVLHPIHSE